MAQFVEYLYSEATGALTAVVDVKITKRGMQTPLGVLSQGQIDKGEDVLFRIDAELDEAGGGRPAKLQVLFLPITCFLLSYVFIRLYRQNFIRKYLTKCRCRLQRCAR